MPTGGPAIERAGKHGSWHGPGTQLCGGLDVRFRRRTAERPEPVRADAGVGAPEIVAGEVDVLPAERGEMGQQRVGYHLAAAAQDVECAAEIDAVP